jgi:hypothetical protein
MKTEHLTNMDIDWAATREAMSILKVAVWASRRGLGPALVRRVIWDCYSERRPGFQRVVSALAAEGFLKLKAEV